MPDDQEDLVRRRADAYLEEPAFTGDLPDPAPPKVCGDEGEPPDGQESAEERCHMHVLSAHSHIWTWPEPMLSSRQSAQRIWEMSTGRSGFGALATE